MKNHETDRTTEPPDQRQRRRITEELDRTMLVEAAAGTGKTTGMIGRMVALIREGRCRIDTMAAITFTRKAATELRSRFQIELERAARKSDGEARDRLSMAVANVDKCTIGTIHSFCARLLRERPIEAGVNLAFEEIDNDEDERLREQAWDDYVARLYAGNDPLLDGLRELGLHVDQLRSSFLAFADYPDVDEWPAGGVEISDLQEIRDELAAYIEHVRDLIPTFPADRGTDRLMSTYERIDRLVRNRDLSREAELMEVLEAFSPSVRATQGRWPEGRAQGKAEKERWDFFAANYAAPVLRNWRAKRYVAVIKTLMGAMEVYDRYRQWNGRLNFQDLLMCASHLLRDKPQVRRYFRRRFTHLLVDEFQDTDPIQAEVMMYLTASQSAERDWRRCVPEPGSLFVVGDPKQSIYRFRRADIVTYNQVKEIIKASGGSIVSLSANFRTLGELVWWVNGVFVDAFPPEATVYSPASKTMQIGRHGGTEGDLSGIKVIEVPADLARRDNAIEYDADLIARTIRHALDARLTVPRSQREIDSGAGPQVTPGDFMIVNRNKGQLAHYARKLQELGIPHQVSGGSALGQVGELKLLIACVRAVAEPENPVALVAALRGELFGFSDTELYAYKRAGGRFSYRSDCPEGLDAGIAESFRDAYARIRRYSLWLKRMPAVPALERIAADLGLPMNALARPGGDVQAGCIAKVFQMLRAASGEIHSAADLVEHLSDLVNRNAEFDGVPVRSPTEPVVRLMNLHKVKGLEAPVVFLANPTGKWTWPVSLHVDRSEGKIRAYMAVYSDTGGRRRQLLACPAGWEQLADEERRFEEAEANRLLYVAATRAGTQLVITRKLKRGYESYWDYFTKYIERCEALPDPGPQAAPEGRQIEVTGEDIEAAATAISERWRSARSPTYLVAAAKAISVSSAGARGCMTTGEHGTEWGSVIHTLLEIAMRDPSADLERLAHAVVQEQGLESIYVWRAVRTVESVMHADIWTRAATSEKVLVEVPFALCPRASEFTGRVHVGVGFDGGPAPVLGEGTGEGGKEGLKEGLEAARESDLEQEADWGRASMRRQGREVSLKGRMEEGRASAIAPEQDLPVILRGAIDLVFREKDGWVIVDYKSDTVTAGLLPDRVECYRGQVALYAEAWREITGEPVKETGLYFTHVGEYVVV